MKTKLFLASALLFAASVSSSFATYYLVGENQNWEVARGIAFDGTTLTATISGEFKIVDVQEWNSNYTVWYGASANGHFEFNSVNQSATLNSNNAPNLYLQHPLEYTFTIENGVLTVSGFKYYIVGDFNNWTPEEMSFSNDTYSIERQIKVGEKFKFVDYSDKTKANYFGGGTNDDSYNIHNDWCTNISLTQGDGGKNFIINRAGTYTFNLTSNRVLSVDGFPPLVSISDNETSQDNIINTLNYYKSYGKEVDFVMTGRTIYMRQWNTICLPFSLTNDQLQLTFLKEYTIKKMSGSSLDADGTLYLNFESQNAITAGVPYLIYCGKSGASDLYEPRFDNVVIDRSSADYFPHFPDESNFYASFIGTFVPYQLEAGPDKYYYLGENSTLYYPSEAVTVGPFRAYFQVTFPESSGAGIKSYCLNFDEETTGIKAISNLSNTSNASNAIYTLDGRRINGQPATAGLYIINGKKIMIK